MKNQLIILIAVILNYTIIYGQNIDFIRLGNKIQPLLGRNFFEKSQTGITNQNKILGILGQESQWLGVKSRQSLDLKAVVFTDSVAFFNNPLSPYDLK